LSVNKYTQMKKTLLSITFISLSFLGFSQEFVDTVPCFRNVVLEEMTGIACGHCPDGHIRAKTLQEENPGRIILVNIHAGGFSNPQGPGTDFRTSTGNYINTITGASQEGYPSGSVNRFDHDLNGNKATGRGEWTSIATPMLTEPSPVNIAGKASIDVATRTLTLDIEAYYTAVPTGENDKLHVFILQNNIKGPQTNYGYNSPQTNADGSYTHSHMLRYALTSSAGFSIPENTEGTLFQKQFTYTLPDQYKTIDVPLNELEIVAFISNENEIYTGCYAQIELTSSETFIKSAINNLSLENSLGSCDGSVSPILELFNQSNYPVDSAVFTYTVNGNNTGSYTLNTSNNPLGIGYTSFYLPGVPLEENNNNIEVTLTEINGFANNNTNNTASIQVNAPKSIALDSGIGRIDIVVDQYGAETTWKIVNETTGATITQGGPYPNDQNGTLFSTDFTLTENNSCYSFIISDEYGDGICCSQTNGNGSYMVVLNEDTLGTGGEFSSSEGVFFKVGAPIDNSIPEEGIIPTETTETAYSVLTPVNPVDTTEANSILTLLNANTLIFPNPAQDVLTIQNNTGSTFGTYQLFDVFGKSLIKGDARGKQSIQLNVRELSSGSYIIQMFIDDVLITKRFSIL